MAAASADSFVYVFEARTGLLRARLGPHGDDVNAVAWHPSGRYLATALDAKDTARIVIWDVAACAEAAAIDGHEHGVFALAYSPSGDRLVSAAEDGTARVWDSANGTELLVLEHPGDPETVDWSPCGRFIASGCDDSRLRLWDADTGREIASHLSGGAVRFVGFDGAGARLLTGSYEGLVRLHSVPDLAVTGSLSAPFQWERAAAFGPGESIFVGSFGGSPIRHDGTGAARTKAPTLGINCIAAGTAGILAGRDDGCILGVESETPLYWHDSIVNAVIFTPDGRIASADYRGALKLFDVARGVLVATRNVPGGPVNSIAFDAGTGTFFTAGYDGMIRAWDSGLADFKEIGGHDGPVKSLAWCGKSGTLIAGSSDDTISGWRDGRRVFHIVQDGLVLINAVAAHPASAEFASASRDGRIRLWDSRTGGLNETLPLVHSKSIKAIAYNGDGTRLLSGAYDGDGVLWSRTESGWGARILKLHGKPGVPAVAFLGDLALTAGWDGTIGGWKPSGELAVHHRCNQMRTAR
ncbi:MULTISPECIES: WD40 repeat domain-containing protein [unclassified Sphingomonas]|nr:MULTISPECIES: WD40 repeat domain-containing protein [unclassified Sphingomonas]